MATFKWNRDWLDKLISKKVREHKIDFDCPKCEVFLWTYSYKDLEENSEVYCDNCWNNVNIKINIK